MCQNVSACVGVCQNVSTCVSMLCQCVCQHVRMCVSMSVCVRIYDRMCQNVCQDVSGCYLFMCQHVLTKLINISDTHFKTEPFQFTHMNGLLEK